MNNNYKIAEGSHIQEILDQTSLNTFDLRDFIYQVDQKVNKFSEEDKNYWKSILFSELSIYTDLKYLDVSELQQHNFHFIERINSFRRKEIKYKYFSDYILFINSLLMKCYTWENNLEKKKITNGSIYEDLNNFLHEEQFCDLIMKCAFFINQDKVLVKNSHCKKFSEINDQFNTSTKKLFLFKNENQEFENLLLLIRKIGVLIIDFLFITKLNSDNHFKELEKISTNQPHIDVFQVFQTLYKIPQSIINSFNSRILYFYYENILGERRRNVIPDIAYLIFNLNDKVNNIFLEKGINFVGGTDAKRKNILYESQYPLVLNRAALKTIVQRNIYSSKFLGLNNDFISGVKEKTTIIENNQNINLKNWFYEDSNTDTEISFLIADEILFLQSGKREIDIKITFTDESFGILKAHIIAISEATGWEGKQLYQNIFQELFIISATSENSWFVVDDHIFIDKYIDENSLNFKLFINENSPKVTCPSKYFSNKIGLPLLRFQLNKNSYLFGYSFLSKLQIDRINIEVKVGKFKNLQVSNTKGNIDMTIPFSPFGIYPLKGDYIELRSKEILQKNVTSFSLSIDWFNLPNLPNGLTDYYKNYKIDALKNENFKITSYYIDNHIWEAGASFSLFNIKDGFQEGESILDNKSIFDALKVTSSSKVEQEKKPLLRLTLTSPNEGFAYQVYPVLQKELIRSKIRSFNPFRKTDNVLPEPFSPIAEELTVNYEAKSVILLNQNNFKEKKAFYHSIGQKIYSNSSHNPFILPEIGKGIYTELGFENVSTGDVISLLMDIKPSSDEYSKINLSIEWEYLDNSSWKKIPSTHILIDETESLTKTGVFQVKIPHKIGNSSEPLNSNLVWIRGVIPNVNYNISNIINVYNRAIKVQLIPAETSEHYNYGQVLKEKSIVKSVNNLPGVREIYQPLPSSEGRIKESDTFYYDRIAETIKHRNRPIFLSDYEAILLSKFTILKQVACIPVSHENEILTIVIVPSSNSKFPKATGLDIYEVKRFLKEKISSHIKLRVISPIYEKVKVNVSLSFKEGLSEGFYIDEIQKSISFFIDSLSQSENLINLGGRINISDILSYLKTKKYISQIHNLTLIHHTFDNQKHTLVDSGQESFKGSFIKSSKPWSVLVSANHHEINITTDDHLNAGIGLLQVGEDLIINE